MKKAIITLAILVGLLIGNMSGPIQAEINSIQPSDQQKIFIPIVYNDLPPIIPPTTKVLPPETLQNLTSVSSDGATFTFSQETPALQALQPGNVMAGGITPSTPDGFLRKVTGITNLGGLTIVQTTQAGLTDAIQQGSVHISQYLQPATTQTGVPGLSLSLSPSEATAPSFSYGLDHFVLYDKDRDTNTTGDQVFVDGSITINTHCDLEYDIQNFHLMYFYYVETTTQTSDFDVTGNIAALDLSVEKKLLPRDIPIMSVGVLVGGLPVWTTAYLNIKVGVDGSVSEGITAGVRHTSTMTTGARYVNSKWENLSNSSDTYQFNPPTPVIGTSAKVFVGPEISILVDGLTGPKVGLNAFLKLEASSASTPWWTFSAGLEVPLYITGSIFGVEVVNYNIGAIYIEKVLAHANLPPITPSNPSPPDKSSGQPLTLSLTWVGGDPDTDIGDTVKYTVYFGTSNPPITIVSTDQSAMVYNPGTLTANTHYYWQIVAKDNHGAITSGPIWSFTTKSEVVPGDMVLVPAGTFQMGCDPAHNGGYSCYSDELPLHTVTLDAFIIDKNEVTNVQYAQCVAAGSCLAPASTASQTRTSYYNNSAFANYPVIYVSWNDATNYCTWTGKHLPTEAEWEKAARGPIVRAYPWGDQAPTCDLGNFYVNYYCVGDTSAVGSYPAGASPYGALDMAGNVWEWVNDWFQSDYYTASPPSNPPGPASGYYKVARGGGWSYFAGGPLRVAVRGITIPDTRNTIIGFRCATSP